MLWAPWSRHQLMREPFLMDIIISQGSFRVKLQRFPPNVFQQERHLLLAPQVPCLHRNYHCKANPQLLINITSLQCTDYKLRRNDNYEEARAT